VRRINLAVLLLVVLLVAGLGVTVVYRVRDAATAINCRNKLHFLGINLLSLEPYPRATVLNVALPPEKRLSWMTEIYPDYYEGRSRLNRTKAWDDIENWPPRYTNLYKGTKVVEYEFTMADVDFCRCPSAGTHLTKETNFVGVSGVGESAAELPLSDPKAGFFGYDRQISSKDIKDGTSNTIAVAEVLDGGTWTAGGHATVRGVVAADRPFLIGHYNERLICGRLRSTVCRSGTARGLPGAGDYCGRRAGH
jgi:hypothetical protein